MENLKSLIESLRRITEYWDWYQATWTGQAHLLAWVPVLQDPPGLCGSRKTKRSHFHKESKNVKICKIRRILGVWIQC
jgi:hypothetical protein